MAAARLALAQWTNAGWFFLSVTAVMNLSATAGSAAFAEVQLTLQNGRVSIVAKDATVRQILTEWARVGKTQILNVDKIPGAPLTLDRAP